MPLWGKTDAVASQPNWIDLSTYPSGTQLIFVDATEAGTAANKTRGLTNAGWWTYYEYTDADGNTRHKAECVVAMSVSAVDAGDQADDAIAADVANTITIDTQPASASTVAGEVTFTVATTVTNAGTAVYQWQRKAADGTRWANVSGATTDTLALTGQTADEDGDQYRVKITSDNGAPEVTSATATVTFDN